MDFIKKLADAQRAKTQENKEKEIKSTFDIAIKDDKLWITHDYDGIKEIDDNTTAKEIVEIINNFKNTAIKFR